MNSLTIKESVVEVLNSLQYAPGYTDTSMAGIANFIFTAYRMISREVCASSLGPNGRANILIGGQCTATNTLRVFLLSTDNSNVHSLTETLINTNHIFIGAGASEAGRRLPQNPSDLDYFNVLKYVIDDSNVPTVGGHIQYGRFRGNRFIVYGIVELGEGDVHYWRGVLDLNSREFMAGHESFVPGFPYIDPFATFGGA